jgi:hypothetical protein
MDLSIFTNKLGGILSAGLAAFRVDSDSAVIERRAYARMKLDFRAFLHFNGRRLQVRGIDFHRAGSCVRSNQPLPVGAVVFFCAKSYGLIGWATVRWCAWRSPSQYYVGLEFRSPLIRAEVGNWQFSYVPSARGPEVGPVQRVAVEGS